MSVPLILLGNPKNLGMLPQLPMMSHPRKSYLTYRENFIISMKLVLAKHCIFLLCFYRFSFIFSKEKNV